MILSFIAEYKFDNDDYIAVSNGIKNTDFESNIWYEYSIIGAYTIDLKIAHDVGSSVIQIIIDTKIDEKYIDIVYYLNQDFDIKNRNSCDNSKYRLL